MDLLVKLAHSYWYAPNSPFLLFYFTYIYHLSFHGPLLLFSHDADSSADICHCHNNDLEKLEQLFSLWQCFLPFIGWEIPGQRWEIFRKLDHTSDSSCHIATCNFSLSFPYKFIRLGMTLTSCKYMWPFRSHSCPLDIYFPHLVIDWSALFPALPQPFHPSP